MLKALISTKWNSPNTDAVINTNNRYILRNQEDIDLDCITVKNDISVYPIYSAALKNW
jgi:polysaccharide pyruvyl transferase WcaK-like protein